MGLFETIGGLFRKDPKPLTNRPAHQGVSANALPAKAQLSPDPAPPHWPPTGFFPVPVVGESFCKDSIRQIARNHNGETALVYCTAVLKPESDNAHDPNAVAILVRAAKVGYLSRELALQFRQALIRTRIQGATTCDAVILGGGSYADREYDYSIELDFTFDSMHSTTRLTYPEPMARSTEPVLFSQTATEFFIRIPFVDRTTLECCPIGQSVTEWQAPDGSARFLFAPGTIGGTGRIAVLTKDKSPEMLELLDKSPHLSIYKVDGRTLILRGGVDGDPRYAFRERDVVSVLLLTVDQCDANPRQVAVKAFSVASISGNGKLADDSKVCSLVVPLDPSGAETLRKLMLTADVLLAYDAEFHKKTLRLLLGSAVDEKAWGCIRSVWEHQTKSGVESTLDAICERVNVARHSDHSDVSDCQALADILFTHVGKTKRSRTFIGFALAHCV